MRVFYYSFSNHDNYDFANCSNGRDMIVGDSINIPSANRIFATTKSSTINGTKTTKPISKATFSSLKI